MSARTEALILEHLGGIVVDAPKNEQKCPVCEGKGQVLALVINCGVGGERWHSTGYRPCWQCKGQDEDGGGAYDEKEEEEIV